MLSEFFQTHPPTKESENFEKITFFSNCIDGPIGHYYLLERFVGILKFQMPVSQSLLDRFHPCRYEMDVLSEAFQTHSPTKESENLEKITFFSYHVGGHNKEDCPEEQFIGILIF